MLSLFINGRLDMLHQEIAHERFHVHLTIFTGFWKHCEALEAALIDVKCSF